MSPRSATPTTPARSLAQRREALEAANAVRLYRAELKRDLASGAVDWRSPLSHPVHPLLRTMRIETYLRALPGVGVTKARRIMRAGGVIDGRTIGGMTHRTRLDLVKLLHERLPEDLVRERPR